MQIQLILIIIIIIQYYNNLFKDHMEIYNKDLKSFHKLIMKIINLDFD